MIALGLHLEHDAGATLMRDGEIVINVEAERVTGIKHAGGVPATQAAVCAAFAQTGIRAVDVSAIAYSDLWGDWDDTTLPSQLDRIRAVQAKTHAANLVARRGTFAEVAFERILPSAVGRFRGDIPVFLVCHSMSHAAGAAYMAGFSEACGLVFDAYGTCCGMMAYIYKGGSLQRLEHWKDRYLVGAGYHRMGIIAKEICGTNHLDVAGKVMGLQAYGEPVAEWVRYFEERYFPSSAEHGYDDYVRQRTATTFCDGLFPTGLTAGSRSVYDKDYCNLVASMQQAFTAIVVNSVNQLIEETKLPHVFLSGGCAMNIISNSAVAASPRVDSLFVQPNCGDVGQSMGAAILAMRAISGMPVHRPEISTAKRRNPYIGATLIDDPIRSDLPEGMLRSPFNPFNADDRIALAKRLIAGGIVGVITGRSEIGPRALGNRSILAHACFPKMKDIINHRVKHREWWRPFAPVCRLVDACKYFQIRSPSRYMLMNDVVLAQWRAELEAITHVDGTARVQVLENREDNTFLWDLLTEISAQGAIPVLLNTSFNLSRKPLVNSTAEAVELLSSSEMDAAVIGEFIFEKSATLVAKLTRRR